MGLFDFFKKQEAPKAPPKAEKSPAAPRTWPQLGHPLLDIAAIISDGDENVLKELRACLDDSLRYADQNIERYAARLVDPGDGDLDLLQWLALVDVLELEGYVCERDWKDEKPDFVHFLQTRRGMERLGLTVEAKWLSKSGDVAAWCDVVNWHWSGKKCCVGHIGLDSDSYVLFPCTMAERDHLKALARELGQWIE